MDSGASASIIHKSYVSKNNCVTSKTPANQWSTMARFFSTSCEAEIKLTLTEQNIKTYISVPLYVTTKKIDYNVIFGRDLIRELGI